MGIFPNHFCKGGYQKSGSIQEYGRITGKKDLHDIMAVSCDEKF
jgi:hypothetical protein